MGYTHYWTGANCDKKAFGNFSQACAKAFNIFEKTGVAIAFECDEPGRPPEFSSECVRFNGVGDEGYETFYVPNRSGYGFCKTAREPYDTLVVACLCLLEHFVGAEVASDGEAQDWYDGLALARKVIPQCQMPKSLGRSGSTHKITIYVKTELDGSTLLDLVNTSFESFAEEYASERVEVDEDETCVEYL